MSIASWLADGADPAQMSPEEVRRLRGLLATREEQGIDRLESLLRERESLVERGAATPAQSLRRALARRHARMDAEIREMDRGLARVGKELAGLRTIRELLRDGVPLAAPGDCAPLLALLDDASATEAEFADQLGSSLRAGQVSRKVGQTQEIATDLLEIWERMDKGEIPSTEEALRKLDDR